MHHPNPCPAPAQVLLPRIIRSERRQLQRLCAELALRDLPRCAHHPLHVCSVMPGTPCTAQLQGGKLCVSIPLCIQLTDSCGARYSASATLETEVCPPKGLNSCNANSVFIQPFIQLLHAEPVCGCSVNVQLCVTMEIFLLRMEPCAMHPPKPACPSMPLYPQPHW